MKVSRLRRWLTVSAGTALVLLGTAAAIPPRPGTGFDAQLAFDAIVLLARVTQERTLPSDPSSYANAIGLQERLLRTLDGDNSEQALRVVARLHYYYLGEGPGEIYDCIATRKGAALVALLTREREKPKDDCVATLGAASRVCLRSHLSAREFSESLDLLIGTAQQHRKCDLD